MNNSITVTHPGSAEEAISWTIQPISDWTSVNAVRIVIRNWAYFNKIEETMDKIELQLSDGRKIHYKTIQTKRGLATKSITWKELFDRGGKIFD